MRKAFLLTVLVLLLNLVGCDGNNPGRYDEEQIADLLQRQIPVATVDLQRQGDGGFTGTGAAAGGETFRIEVFQDPQAKTLKFNAVGDRGTNVDGGAEL